MRETQEREPAVAEGVFGAGEDVGREGEAVAAKGGVGDRDEVGDRCLCPSSRAAEHDHALARRCGGCGA